MSNELTDRQFWKKYWESKTGLAFIVPSDYVFHKQLERIVNNKQVRSAIELGGFPGYYAMFLKKYLRVDSTLLDYYVHPELLNDVLQVNSLKRGDINVIEADLFTVVPDTKFDMVLSCGLIEHFEDTRGVIEKHLEFLKPGGTLFITLPNFLGINGWVQRKFDPENYSKHNTASMDVRRLGDITRGLDLKDIEINYYGGFSIWLENKKEKSLLTKAFLKALWFVGKVPTKILGFESKALSPYITIQARKDT